MIQNQKLICYNISRSKYFMEYKIATLEEYISVWEKDIAKRPHKQE